jgi:hypothetical protein
MQALNVRAKRTTTAGRLAYASQERTGVRRAGHGALPLTLLSQEAVSEDGATLSRDSTQDQR